MFLPLYIISRTVNELTVCWQSCKDFSSIRIGIWAEIQRTNTSSRSPQNDGRVREVHYISRCRCAGSWMVKGKVVLVLNAMKTHGGADV
jgi:hypothetical protein